MFLTRPRFLMAPEGAGGSAPAVDAKPEPVQPVLPGVAAEPEKPVTAEAKPRADDEAAKLKARIKEFEGAEKKREAERKAADRAKADADAAEHGKAKEALEAKERELTELRARAEQLETAARTRIDTAIGRLPEAVRAEVDLIKDTLPLDKLEAFVELKSRQTAAPAPATTSTDPAPPAPSPGGVDHKRKPGHQLNGTTVEILGELGKDENVNEVAKNLGAIDMGKGDFKWRWKGTGDDKKDTLSFINLLDNLKPDPYRARRDAARKRALGLKE